MYKNRLQTIFEINFIRALARLQTTANLYTITLRRGSAQFLRRNGVKIRDGSRITYLKTTPNKAIKRHVFLLLLPRLFFQIKKSANIIFKKLRKQFFTTNKILNRFFKRFLPKGVRHGKTQNFKG
jgi:hypothetical protein